jgi:hypothetical protein
MFCALLAPAACADFPFPNMVAANSASGQFVVTSSPEFSQMALEPDIATNEDFVRLEPALLAVSAERVKAFVLNKLGVSAEAPWRGQISLAIHPAQSLDENVAIVSSRLGGVWVYHVLLPDVLSRERLARALTAVVLLEYANRNAGERSADLPSWLVEGFAQELLSANLQEFILSAPDHTVNGVPMDRLSETQRGLDTLAEARGVLQNYSVLTFTELSWPTETQRSGEDGGVFRASAQLFTHELLALRNGPEKLRVMLQLLPQFYNWQTAFWTGFRGKFSTPLEVEKWWALQTVIFVSRSPGPQWTPAVSREKLDEILSVPVDFRSASNNLPTRAEISLQSVIRNFDASRQEAILQSKLRDLELAQLRVAPSLAVLTAQYRNALADYLGEPRPRGPAINQRVPQKISARETLSILDTLDARRRAVALAARPSLLDFVPR